jgi:hypothetical protein
VLQEMIVSCLQWWMTLFSSVHFVCFGEERNFHVLSRKSERGSSGRISRLPVNVTRAPPSEIGQCYWQCCTLQNCNSFHIIPPIMTRLHLGMVPRLIWKMSRINLYLKYQNKGKQTRLSTWFLNIPKYSFKLYYFEMFYE